MDLFNYCPKIQDFFLKNNSATATRTVLPQEIRIQMRQVLLRPLPLIDPMTPVRISHELENLIVLDQRIQQPLRILIMHIVIPSAVNI